MSEDRQHAQYRLRTLILAAAVLAAAMALTLVAPFFASALNGTSVLRFPLGYFLAAHGAFILFAVLIFWSASRQEALDRRFGAAEDG